MFNLKIIPAIILLPLVTLISLKAQNIPLSFHYQAVARGPEGFEVRNSEISVKFSIISNDKNGHVQWAEEHTNVITNDFGIFDLNIGAGERIGGLANNFNDIPWGTSPHFLKVEINFNDGYLDMGTSRFLSVPYALYALKSGSAESTQGSGENQLLSLSGDTLRISNGNYVTLKDNVNDADANPENEIQNLSIVGKTLSIDKGGNSVTLPDEINDADADPENEIQIPNLAGNTLTLTKATENPVDLSKYLDNTDAQQLQINSNNLVISGGNQVSLSPYLDNTDNQILLKNGNEISITSGNSIKSDNDTTNEMQDIEFVNDTLLSLTKSDINIDLAKFYDNTDEQTLSTAGNNISISNGNSIISDNDTTNEMQDIEFVNDTLLSLTKSNVNIDLAKFYDNTDEQILSTAGNSISISNGNFIVTDNDTANEIQALNLIQDTLLILSNADTINLAPFFDNTDNQTLSLSNDTLSISGGNSIDITSNKAAFRATVLSGELITDSIVLVAGEELFDIGDCYDDGAGIFTVPNSCGGIYRFEITYSYSNNQSLILIKEDEVFETLLSEVYTNGIPPSGVHMASIILDLKENDTIYIRIKSPSNSFTNNGYIMGYKVY